MVKDRSLSRL